MVTVNTVAFVLSPTGSDGSFEQWRDVISQLGKSAVFDILG